MGRRPTKPGAIPRFRARQRGKVTYYFYDHGGKPRRETSLGTDYGLAIKRWAELEHETNLPQAAVLTFAMVADRYMAEVAVRKASRTLADDQKEVANLKAFFDDPPAPLERIQPVDVRQHMTWRTKGDTSYVRANREKALLSHIWNFARDNGYEALPNACAGIKGFREVGRDAYVEDDQFAAIWEAADACLRDAMDLAYLTGQRPSDVLSISEMDVRDGVLNIQRAKAKAKLRFTVAGEQEELLRRIRARKSAYKVHSTRLVVNEQGQTIGVNAMSRKWAKVCEVAGVTGLQFRDLRAKAATDKAEL